jgi:hypothetical protein
MEEQNAHSVKETLRLTVTSFVQHMLSHIHNQQLVLKPQSSVCLG